MQAGRRGSRAGVCEAVGPRRRRAGARQLRADPLGGRHWPWGRRGALHEAARHRAGQIPVGACWPKGRLPMRPQGGRSAAGWEGAVLRDHACQPPPLHVWNPKPQPQPGAGLTALHTHRTAGSAFHPLHRLGMACSHCRCQEVQQRRCALGRRRRAASAQQGPELGPTPGLQPQPGDVDSEEEPNGLHGPLRPRALALRPRPQDRIASRNCRRSEKLLRAPPLVRRVYARRDALQPLRREARKERVGRDPSGHRTRRGWQLSPWCQGRRDGQVVRPLRGQRAGQERRRLAYVTAICESSHDDSETATLSSEDWTGSPDSELASPAKRVSQWLELNQP